MTPPPPATARANSAAARDIANALHPYTDLRAHPEVGPMIISRGEGVRVWDENGKGYIESVAGLWCASLGFSNERLVQAAAAQMRKLPFYHAFTAKSHEPMIDLAEMLIAARAGADEQGVLRQLRVRGERQRHQDGLVFQQRRRPPEEEEDHRPHQGLSRHHARRRRR